MVKNLNTVERSTRLRFGRYVPDEQEDNSVLINASALPITVGQKGLYVAPIRFENTELSNTLVYNLTTKEVTDSGVRAYQLQGLQSVAEIGNTTTETLELNATDTSLVTASNVGVANAYPEQTLVVGDTFTVDDDTGLVTVKGNLYVTGDTTSVTSVNLTVHDPIIALGANNTNINETFDVGVIMQRADPQNVAMVFKEDVEELLFTYTGSTGTDRYVPISGGVSMKMRVEGDMYANAYFGNGATLDNVALVWDFDSNVQRIENLESNLLSNSARTSNLETWASSNNIRMTNLENASSSNAQILTQTRNQLENNSQRITTLYGWHASNVLRIESLESAMDNANTNIDHLWSNLQDNSSRITTLSSRLIDNSSRISTNTSEIAQLKVRATDLESNLSSNSTRTSTLESNVALLGPYLADNSSRTTTLEANVALLGPYLTDNSSRVGVLEANVALLGPYLTDNSSRTASLEGIMPTKAPINNPIFTGVISGDGGGISNVSLEHVVTYGNTTANTLQFVTNDVSFITEGRVGVNTPTPDALYSLDVAGDVHTDSNVYSSKLFAQDCEITGGENKISGNTSFYGNVNLYQGNLRVYGAVTNIQSENIFVKDPILGVGNDGTSDSGVITVSGGPSNNVAFGWNNTLQEYIIAYTEDSPYGTTLTPNVARDLPIHAYGTIYTQNAFGVANTNPLSSQYALSVGSNIFARHDGDIISIRTLSDTGIFSQNVTTNTIITDSPAITLDADNTVVTGNLDVRGAVTYVSTQDLVVNDPIIELANGNTLKTTSIGIKHLRPDANVMTYYDGTVEEYVFAHVDAANHPDLSRMMNVHVYGQIFANDTVNVGSNCQIQDLASNVVTVDGNVKATNNVFASYFIGNGSALTGLVTDLSSVSNNGATSDKTIVLTNVTTGLEITESNLVVAGNTTSGYYLGDGQFLSNVTNTSVFSATITAVNSNVSDNSSRVGVLESNVALLGPYLSDNSSRTATLEANVALLGPYLTDNSSRVGVLEANVALLGPYLTDNSSRTTTLEANVALLGPYLTDNSSRTSTLEANVALLGPYLSDNSSRVGVLEANVALLGPYLTDNSSRTATLEANVALLGPYLTDNSSRVGVLEANVALLGPYLTDNSSRTDTLEANVALLGPYLTDNSSRVGVLEANVALLGPYLTDNSSRVGVLEANVAQLGPYLTDNSSRVGVLEANVALLGPYLTDNSSRVGVLEANVALLGPYLTDNSSRVGVLEANVALLGPYLTDNSSRLTLVETNKAENLDPVFESNITVSNNLFMTDLTASRVVFVGVDNELTDDPGLTWVTGTSTLTVDGDCSVSGNLHVEGSVITLHAENTIMNDAIIELANNNVSDTTDMGIIMTRPTSNVAIGYRGDQAEFMIGHTHSDPSSVDLVPDLTNDLDVNVYGRVMSKSLDIRGTANTGALTATTAQVNGDFTMVSTATGSSAAPDFTLWRNNPDPRTDDYLGQVKFAGENSTGGTVDYAKMTGKISSNVAGAEDGLLEVAVQDNSTFKITTEFTNTDLKLINGTGLEVAGNVAVDTDTLFVDVNADRVGINTSTPIYDLDVHGTANCETLNVNTIQGLQTLSFTSLNTTTPPLQLTAGSLGDGVGALRIDSVEPDIYLNDTDGGFSTVTFADDSNAYCAFGRNSSNNFYITVRDPSVNGGNWRDDTLAIDRTSGDVNLGYKLSVNDAPFTGSNVLEVGGTCNATAYYGSGAYLSDIASNLHQVVENGNVTSLTVELSNTHTALKTDLVANVDVKLDQLNSVNIQTLESNQSLIYDGTNWVNTDNAVRSYVKVHNNTGSQINRGQALYVYSSWNTNVANVALARADSSSTMPVIGVASENISTGNEGLAVTYGKVNNVDCTGFIEGETLYVSNVTAGGLANVKPFATTDLIQNVGLCVSSGSSGVIFITGIGRSNDVPNAVEVSTQPTYVYVNSTNNEFKKMVRTDLQTKLPTLQEVTDTQNSTTESVLFTNTDVSINAYGNVESSAYFLGDGTLLTGVALASDLSDNSSRITDLEANTVELASNIALKADKLDPTFDSNITVTNHAFVGGGLVAGFKKTYSYAGSMTNSNVAVEFTSNVFYGKIVAQLTEGYSNVSTYVLEVSGGKNPGGGTTKDIRLGTQNKFGEDYPWSTTVATDPTHVVIEPTSVGTTNYDYSFFVEYVSAAPDGQVVAIKEDGSAVQNFYY